MKTIIATALTSIMLVSSAAAGTMVINLMTPEGEFSTVYDTGANCYSVEQEIRNSGYYHLLRKHNLRSDSTNQITGYTYSAKYDGGFIAITCIK